MSTTTQEAAEMLAFDLADWRGKGIDLPPSNPDRVAHHLAVAMTATPAWADNIPGPINPKHYRKD